MQKYVYVALDTEDLTQAERWAEQVADQAAGLKLGLEFFLKFGIQGVRQLQGYGLPIFLDLKLYDIPNTMRRATAVAVEMGVEFLTVHASAGRAALAACQEEVARQAVPLKLLAVTVLTSFDALGMQQVYGADVSMTDAVHRLAGVAGEAGVNGFVASAHEAQELRQQHPQATLMIPGIRPQGAETQDQSRVMTPSQAVAQGADYLVMGRPITQAADPSQALISINQEIHTHGRH